MSFPHIEFGTIYTHDKLPGTELFMIFVDTASFRVDYLGRLYDITSVVS